MATEEKRPITYSNAITTSPHEKSPVTYATPVAGMEEELEKGEGVEGEGLAHWQPGFFAQFPWLGIGALGGVLACLIAAVVVLVCSNHKTQTRTAHHRPWPKAVAPNVLISIFNSVANICFGIAISNGIAIAWWRRALKGGTIKDLNKSWQFSSSVKEIALAGKAFNIIALTALVTKMTVIDSTLLQKAIGTYTQTDLIGLRHNVTWGFINETFPSTGAGFSTTEAGAGLQPWFNQDLLIWQVGGGVFPNQFTTYDHENGVIKNPVTKKVKTAPWIDKATMYLNLSGAGFGVYCAEEDYSTTAIDVSNLLFPEYDIDTGVPYTPNATNFTLFNQQLYGLNFSVHIGVAGSVPDGPDAWINNTDYILMDVVSSKAFERELDNSSYACPGTLYKQTCRLRPAVVSYPVQLTQRGEVSSWTATLATDQNQTLFYDYNQTGSQQSYHDIVRYQDVKDIENGTLIYTGGASKFGNNTLGGLAYGLNAYLGGYSWVKRDTNGIGFLLNATGSAQGYLNNLPDVTKSACDFQYGWPLSGGTELLGESGASGPASGNAHSAYVDPGVLGSINSIMFALATDVSIMDSNNKYDATYDGFDSRIWMDTIHYQSNYCYMAGAIASTIICILCVLPSYWGFWQLGRKVTLGPFEIAAAFRAPNLNHPTAANAPVDKLIEEVGDRRVQFGHIISGSDAGRIGVAEPEFVERAKPKIGVAGEEIKGRFSQAFGRKR
ncbi:uncharacterized protein MYCFIDRAFT_83076 [Pseudocercospora fijiensis CIRAD86]|uniref:Uncharacterized protein n=1 Tax=Pseudocercospora fijiensis (strain CIRAD86) TaxID=383855 RepID=M3AKD4_PSEFD|nr:uncharacterized protein MYCFIDRAFT_83076 [Pseudocercospora fijiensis CIRAD86]EME85046.1 hypothetical protein MYCFIDRAFT_83076 [Pseudocercospora fijiensis CIRAD86]